jgi:hypothetical protein
MGPLRELLVAQRGAATRTIEGAARMAQFFNLTTVALALAASRRSSTVAVPAPERAAVPGAV